MMVQIPRLVARFLLLAGLLPASAPCAEWTLAKATRQAMERYPAVAAALADASAAASRIDLARSAFLPRADFLGQINRATHNNVFGMIFQQQYIPPISGPVLRTNSLNSVWGSYAGLLFTWEPFDLGLRKANVEVAGRAKERAQAAVELTRLQTGAAAADAFLTMLAAGQTRVAAEAGVERARVLDTVVATLVKNELRPGADGSRSQAELALAETQLIQAEQAFEAARIAVARMTGEEASSVQAAPGRLYGPAPETAAREPSVTGHPAALIQSAILAESKARQNALDKSFRPQFHMQGASYARGSGVQPDGRTSGAASGLGPNIQNWGLAMSVTFPLLDFYSLRAKKASEDATAKAEEARLETIRRDVHSEVEQARNAVAGARRMADKLPVQLQAARAGRAQAEARYRSGLGTLVEVAEAQRLQTQTEIDAALSRLNVWRALLRLAVAEGDLEPFLAMTEK